MQQPGVEKPLEPESLRSSAAQEPAYNPPFSLIATAIEQWLSLTADSAFAADPAQAAGAIVEALQRNGYRIEGGPR